MEAGQELREVLYHLRNDLVDIRWIPDVMSIQLLGHRIGEFLGLPAIQLNSLPDCRALADLVMKVRQQRELHSHGRVDVPHLMAGLGGRVVSIEEAGGVLTIEVETPAVPTG